MPIISVHMNSCIAHSFGAFIGSKHMDVGAHLEVEKRGFQEWLLIQNVTTCKFLQFILN